MFDELELQPQRTKSVSNVHVAGEHRVKPWYPNAHVVTLVEKKVMNKFVVPSKVLLTW